MKYNITAFYDEAIVSLFLQEKFGNTRNSSRQENIENDIDLWLGSTPISIKAQQEGVRYQNICLELYSQRGVIPVDPGFNPYDVLTIRSRVRETTSPWFLSWFNSPKSKAEYLAILQGSQLRVLHKLHLLDLIEEDGFTRVVNLKDSTYENQDYLDTICGYLSWDMLTRIPQQVYTIDRSKYEPYINLYGRGVTPTDIPSRVLAAYKGIQGLAA